MNLLQIHHQFKDKTEMVAQLEVTSNKMLRDYIAKLKISDPLPEDAQWMVCNEESEFFVKMYKEGGNGIWKKEAQT